MIIWDLFNCISCSFTRSGLTVTSTSLALALRTTCSFPKAAESMMTKSWSSFKTTLQVIQFLKAIFPFLSYLCSSYFSAMNADLDGSEIIEPLQAVFELPTVDGYARQVFVITDGVVNKSEPYYKSFHIYSTHATIHRFPTRMMWFHWSRSVLGKLAYSLLVLVLKNALSIQLNQSNFQFGLKKVWAATYLANLLRELLRLETERLSLLHLKKDWGKKWFISCVTHFIRHGLVSGDWKYSKMLLLITILFKNENLDIKLKWKGFGKEDLMGTKPLLRQTPANGKVILFQK